MSIFKLIKAFRPLLSGPESHEKQKKEFNHTSWAPTVQHFLHIHNTLPVRYESGHSFPPLQLLSKRESRGSRGDAHTVGRKRECYRWDRLCRGIRRQHVTSLGPPAPVASGWWCFPSDPISPVAVENNRHCFKQQEGRTGMACRHLKKLKAIGVTYTGGERRELLVGVLFSLVSQWALGLCKLAPTVGYCLRPQPTAIPHAVGSSQGLLPSRSGAALVPGSTEP